MFVMEEAGLLLLWLPYIKHTEQPGRSPGNQGRCWSPEFQQQNSEVVSSHATGETLVSYTVFDRKLCKMGTSLAHRLTRLANLLCENEAEKRTTLSCRKWGAEAAV